MSCNKQDCTRAQTFGNLRTCADVIQPCRRNKQCLLLLLLCFGSLILKIASVYANSNMKAVLYKPGGVENLSIATVAKPTAGKTQVLIRTHHTALNRADTLQRRELNPPSKIESESDFIDTH